MKLDTITNKRNQEGGINQNDEFYTPSYAIKPLLNPPFSSVYITHNILPKQIVFEEIEKY